MGILYPIKKWDFARQIWRNPENKYELGRCFSFGVYDTIINDESNKGFHYIILASGSRVEDHSKNKIDISENQFGMKKIIDYFKNKKGNYKILLFLMDADAPIKEDSKLMASVLDDYANNMDVKTINFMGLSKCGTMAFYIPKYLKSKNSFEKINLSTIAPPFEGTKMASPKLFYPVIEAYIVNIFGKNSFSKLVYNQVIKIYEGISSNSHMDYDIAVPNGVFDRQLVFYDPTFITGIFDSSNIEAIKKVNSYTNFVTGIDDFTLRESIKNMDITGIALCILNELFMDSKSDGMIPVDSQRAIGKWMDPKTINLKSSHHSVVSIPRIMNDILWNVNDTIEEAEDRKKARKKN